MYRLRYAVWLLLAWTAGAGADKPAMLRSLQVELPGQEQNVIKTSWPGIGCWFWSEEEFKPEGYKRFLDLHAKHSAFRFLTTSIRHPVEVTDPEVHDQIKAAAEYARGLGMGIVMDLDVRLARGAFERRHPDEMQEIVRLREVALGGPGEAALTVEPINLGDHYTYRARGYDSIAARVLRVYSYVSGPQGIEPGSVEDITDRVRVEQADAKGVRVSIPRGRRGFGTHRLRPGGLHAVYARRLRPAPHRVRTEYPPAVRRCPPGGRLQGRVGIPRPARPAPRRPLFLAGHGRGVRPAPAGPRPGAGPAADGQGGGRAGERPRRRHQPLHGHVLAAERRGRERVLRFHQAGIRPSGHVRHAPDLVPVSRPPGSLQERAELVGLPARPRPDRRGHALRGPDRAGQEVAQPALVQHVLRAVREILRGRPLAARAGRRPDEFPSALAPPDAKPDHFACCPARSWRPTRAFAC